MNKILNPINWTDFPKTTDFEGVAIINFYAQNDDDGLESPKLQVAKRGNELIFVGPEIDIVTRYHPERACDFPRQIFITAMCHAALYQSSFASRCMPKDGSLKKGDKWEICLFKNAD